MNSTQWNLAMREIAKLDIEKTGPMLIASNPINDTNFYIRISFANPIDMKREDMQEMFKVMEYMIKLKRIEIHSEVSGQQHIAIELE